jgi:subtilisin family serine protease
MMRRYLFFFLALVIAIPAAGWLPANEKKVELHNADHFYKPIKDQYIVVLTKGSDPQKLVDDLKITPIHLYDGAGGGLVGFAAKLDQPTVDALELRPEVELIELDGEVGISEVQQTGATWGLDRIEQRFLPLDGDYWYYLNAVQPSGATTHAYVIDTGILFSHVDFGGRATTAPGQTYSALGGSALDNNGHGTHVAATLGGTTFGVAKDTTLHAVKVLNSIGMGTWSDVIAGVNWVTANRNDPAVANMSLSDATNRAADLAINASVASGVFYAVSAGNFSFDACNFSPASATGAMAVASTDATDTRGPFSNWGPCVDIFAPGEGITSAWNSSTTATSVMNGTSAASPHVAGAAALYLSQYPWAPPALTRGVLTFQSTPGVVASAGTGSPNLLLYSKAFDQLGSDTGSLSTLAQIDIPFNGVAFHVKTPALLEALLAGSAGTNFNLTLYQFNSTLGVFMPVASSSAAGSTEHLLFHGPAGNYYWEVSNGSAAAGTYTILTNQP